MELIISMLEATGYTKIDDRDKNVFYSQHFLETDDHYYCLDISFPMNNECIIIPKYIDKNTKQETTIPIPKQYNNVINNTNVLQNLISLSIWIKQFAKRSNNKNNEMM